MRRDAGTLLFRWRGGGLVRTGDVRGLDPLLVSTTVVEERNKWRGGSTRTSSAPAPWMMLWPASVALSEAPDPSRGIIVAVGFFYDVCR